jgi:hypothetical protein
MIGSVAEVPTRTCPKSSETGVRTRVGGVVVPKRLMKSSEELESETISSALLIVLLVCEEDACGAKVMLRGQLAPGTMLGHEPVTLKSAVVVSLMIWIVVVPVLVSVTIWGVEALPPAVAPKVSEP